MRATAAPPIRILFVAGQFGVGGMEKRIAGLLHHLDPAQFNAELLVLGEQGFTAALLPANVPISVLDREEAMAARTLQRSKAVIGACRRFQPDILHACDQIGGLYGRVAGRWTGVPVVLTSFNTNFIVDNRLRLAERLLKGLTDGVICNSAAGADYMVNACDVPRRKVFLVTQGLDLGKMTRAAPAGSLRAELGIPPESRLVGTVGKLHPDKDPHTFIAAATLIRERFRDVHFCVVGSGPDHIRVRDAIAARGLAANFHLVAEREDAPRLSREFDVAVLTSMREGLPNTLLEYMYWARPVVVTAVGECARVVVAGETGWVVPPGDAVAVARAITEALDCPARAAAMGAAGRDRLLEHYTFDRYAAEMSALYRNAVAASEKGRKN